MAAGNMAISTIHPGRWREARASFGNIGRCVELLEELKSMLRSHIYALIVQHGNKLETYIECRILKLVPDPVAKATVR